METYKELALEIAEFIDDKKGEDIIILDLRGKSSLTDFFVIATGLNDRNTAAIAHHVEDMLEKKGIEIHHKEGHRAGEWVVLDYIDIIVHIFNEEKREYYSIERIWQDAERIEPQFAKVN
ncbi:MULTISPECIES: ribosome silencing factor [unclassified Fusibacter]|uniref:ribosome silencing factor n=1 Tax=unclassified Fusibacter TaxID=2624464 RepID=UPI001012E375|nr:MULTISPECIES: ribosome silencing factor [unclassified Fusibacter]MCK8060686.1 ribosome silencing factor [Fusibacter sp. A2]NPE22860.1 ribosome silencing factor [Fusibacter sp. A1]RXV59929.1 ribosome silencing factor [Fusibacter sp. A1]